MTTIAVLGTGIMGAPMARNLATSGFAVRAWNRTIDKAKPLAERGVVVCESAQDAARDADFVLTMLADIEAVVSVIDGADGPFTGAGSPVWLQMSTVGIDGTQRLPPPAPHPAGALVSAPAP